MQEGKVKKISDEYFFDQQVCDEVPNLYNPTRELDVLVQRKSINAFAGRKNMIKNDENKQIIVELDGRIDASNVETIEKNIFDEFDFECDYDVYIDADKLNYISSAGLRFLLKFRKKISNNFYIINTSREVYEIFEVTGFIDLFTVKKKLREMKTDGMEIIGTGFFGTVYKVDSETIVKVYENEDAIPMIENEKKMAKMAFIHGIPTAISYDMVKVGNGYGSVFEMLNSKTFNQMVIDEPEKIDEILIKYVDFLKLVHSKKFEDDNIPKAKDIFIGYIDIIADYFDENTVEKLRTFLTDLPYDNHVVHGDFQMKNVMISGDEPMLIDMDTLSVGQPIFDLQALFITYKAFPEDEPNNTMNFLGITTEMSDYIWDGVINNYYKTETKDQKDKEINHIKLLGYIRFLFMLKSYGLENGELGQTRVKHTVAHIKELCELCEAK